MIGEIIKSLAKQLIVTGIVIAISIAIMSVNPTAGIILMMLYSSFMVVKSSSKEMPLGKFTAILPGLMSLAAFFIMLELIGVRDDAMPLIGIALGIIPGWLMARGHKVYEKNGILYAKRTLLYVFIWAISLLFTQGSTLLGMREITDFVFLLNGFSTAMMVVLSVILFIKTTTEKKSITSKTYNIISILSLVFFLFFIIPSDCKAKNMYAIQGKGSYTMGQIFDYIFEEEYSQLLARNAKRQNIESYGDRQTDSFSKYLQSGRTEAEVYFTIHYFNDRAFLDERLQDKFKYYTSKYETLKNSNVHIPKYNSLGSGGRGMMYSYTVNPYQGNKIRRKIYIVAGGRAVWQYKQWLFLLDVKDYPYFSNSLLGSDYEHYINRAVSNIQSRIKNVDLINHSVPSVSYNQQPNPKPSKSSDFSDKVTELSSDKYLESLTNENGLNNNNQNILTQDQTNNDPSPQPDSGTYPDSPALEFSDDELIAGAAAALLMLLASLGLNASMAAAQGASSSIAETGKEDTEADSPLVDPYDDEPLPEGYVFNNDAQEWQKQPPDSKKEPISTDDNQSVEKVPKEEKSFLGGIWDRVSDGITGLGSDIYNAGKDIYNNPSLIFETAKNAGKEIYDTGAAAVEGTKNFIKGVNNAISDCVKDPSIIWETAKDTASDIADGIKSGMKFAEITAADLGQAAKDTYKDPMLAWDTVTGMGSDIKSGATYIKNFASDPDKVVDVVKNLVGIEDFEKSLDPNNSLVKRLGHVALGVTNIYGAITGVSAAGQGLKNGATTLIGQSGVGSLADDAVRIAASTADDAGRASASSAAGGLTDDASRLGSRAIGASDDIAKAGSKAAGSADDIANVGSKVTGPADDIAKSGSRAAGSTDDAIKAGAGVADDATKAGAKTKGSTIRPGKATDFVAADTPPDLSGYTEASKKHIQMVADQHGATIHTRPTNSYAKDLLERGEALSKPELLKNKSINKLDTLLGANSDDLGKVGHFKPKMPQQGTMSDDVFGEVSERYGQRMQEFKDQSSYLANHADEVTVKNGLILDVKTGKPFTGDVDAFAIRGLNGEPLSQAVVDRIQHDLKYGVSGTKLSPGNINHGVHTEWDYSKLARNDTTRHITAVADQHGVRISGNADDGFRFANLNGKPLPESVANQIERDIKYGIGGTKQSKFDIAKGIDNKIRSSHMEGAEKVEALVTFTGRSGMGSPAPTSSWWRGGLNGKTLAKDSM